MSSLSKKTFIIILCINILFVIAPYQLVNAAAQLPAEAFTVSNYMITLPNTATANEIQSEINKASKAGGGVVTLSSGTYILDDNIELKSNVTLQGQGTDATWLKKDPDYLVPDGEGFLYSKGGLFNVIVKNLSVDANTDTTPLDSAPERSTCGLLVIDTSGSSNDTILFEEFDIINASMGFHVKGTYNLVVKNCDFSYNGGYKLYYHNLYLRRVYTARLYNCIFSHSTSGNGVNISFSENITVDSCQSYSNYFRGIRAASSTGVDVINCNVYDNKTGDGIIMNYESYATSDFRILCCTVSNNGKCGIQVTAACSNGHVWNNTDGGGNKSGYMSINGSKVDDTFVGDANGDRKITAIDAYLVLNNPDTIDKSIADVNQDDIIDIKDVLDILHVASHSKLYF